ncbi:MAG: hypothetical protein LCH92_15570 [Proteobacteria bacterium]|nr:hypothetical protein [Pseudomonadota bacterium]
MTRAGTLGLILGVFVTSAAPAGALALDTQCPAVWEDVIDSVREAIWGVDLSAPLVFSDLEGRAYDCLNYGVPFQWLYSAGITHRDIVDIIGGSADPELGPGHWPPGTCSIARYGNLWFIGLPRDPRFYVNGRCLQVILNSVSHSSVLLPSPTR